MVSISQMGRQGSRTAMAEVETQTDVATNKMNLNCETLNTEESKIRTRILCHLLEDLPFHNIYNVVIRFGETFICLGECVINCKCYLIQRTLSPGTVKV